MAQRPPHPNPIAVARAEAAALIGVSPTLFDDLVEAGTMPRPRQINRRVLWSVAELDRAFHALPQRGHDREVNPWDRP